MYHTMNQMINDDSYNLSMRLSEVLDDIGVNERMVMKRRKIHMLTETMFTIKERLSDRNVTIFFPGSQSEGTTTNGLQSDLDTLHCDHDYNVIKDMAGWKQGKINLLMLQDNNTTPGYCSLQQLRSDVPLPMTELRINSHIRDKNGRVLMRNDMCRYYMIGDEQRHGPSLETHRNDYVLAFPCVSWPQATLDWLQQQRCLSPEIKQYAISSSCFVVGVGGKVGRDPRIEWRISTTLAERCLMYNLNITQIRCYVLMKMIVKSYLNLNGENNLSSFMCKTVLLHCVHNVKSNMWNEGSLFTCLYICFVQLNNCLLKEECPHFIIKENNLMAGQFTSEERYRLQQTINHLVGKGGLGLLGITIDDVGERLKFKMNKIPQLKHYISSKVVISQLVSFKLYINLSCRVTESQNEILQKYNLETLPGVIQKLIDFSNKGNKQEHTACRLLAPRLVTSLGSMMSSSSISLSGSISHQALTWFSLGLKSKDVSGRLKLASMYFCAGDMEQTEVTLKHISQQYNNSVLVPLCGCCDCSLPKPNYSIFLPLFSEQNVASFQNYITHCVRFMQSEKNCVPHELQFEMFRSTQEDMRQHRNEDKDYWMSWAVVDSLPFLYFLQYKVYSRLKKRHNQQEALNDLIWVIETNENLSHKETDLNLLGQVMEAENRPKDALKYFSLSLQIRPRNNAASILFCKVLATKIFK